MPKGVYDHWQIRNNPFFKLVRSKATKRAYELHPEYRLKTSEASKRNWRNPEYRAKILEKRKKQWTPEARKRASASHKGITFTEEHKRRISKSNKGKKLSDETKKKISESLKKNPRVPWNKGKHGIFSEETLDKIRKARLRQKIPFEYTTIERAIEQLLEELQIPHVHSFNLGDKFLCDFAIPSAHLIIECDGDYWHSLPEIKRRDRAKDAYALKCGWKVLRLSESEILNDMTSCKERIINEVRDTLLLS